MSSVLQFTTSDYNCGIFKLFSAEKIISDAISYSENVKGQKYKQWLKKNTIQREKIEQH
jgi:hypothetical protein